MRKVLAVLAFLVFLHPDINARAEVEENNLNYVQEEPQKNHKNAEKVIAFLRLAGWHNDTMKGVAYFVDERVDDGYFKFSEHKFEGINMQFRYNMDGFHRENFELNFKPDDSNFELNANPEKVMLRYQLKF